MNQIKPWIIASRPKTLPAGAGPVLIGLALAYPQFHFFTGFLTLLCALLLQISSNLINDYYDGVKGTDNEGRLGPPRATALGLLKPDAVKKGFFGTLSLAFLFGIILMVKGGTPIVIIGFASLFFAWAYTGGPFPLSYFGLGELFAFLFFGPIAVYGTWYLQTFDVSPPWPILIAGFGVGMISSALMGVNNLRDLSNDKAVNKTTMATIVGDQAMRKIILIFLILSLAALFFLFATRPIALLIGLIPFCLFSRTWFRLLGTTRGRDLNGVLENIGKYLFLYSLFTSLLLTFFLNI